jgi:outer membrane protein assembly factor BamB
MFRFDSPSGRISHCRISFAMRGWVAALLTAPLLFGSVLSGLVFAQDATPVVQKEATEQEPAEKVAEKPAAKPTEKPAVKPEKPAEEPAQVPKADELAEKPEPPKVVPPKVVPPKAVPPKAVPAKAVPAKPVKPVPPNPVQQIFKQIFRGGGLIPAPKVIVGPRPANPKATKPDLNKDGSVMLDAVDRRAPVETRQSSLHQRALRAAENKEWNLVVEIVEALFNPRAFPHDTLIRRKDGSLVSIRREAIDLLGRVPEEHREIYIREFSTVADRLLREAIESGDTTQLVEVATRYFWTPSGPRAADVLATRHLDRGEFTIAATWLEQLLAVKSPLTETAAWKRKATVAFRIAGRDDLADQLKVEGIDPEVIGTRLSITQPVSSEEWLMLFANPRRFAVGDGSAPVLLKRWTMPTTWNRPLERKIDEMIDGFSDSNQPTLPVAMPLLVNGKIICRTFRGVQVADATTGRPLWSVGSDQSIEAMLTGQTQATQVQVQMGFNPVNFIQSSSSSGGPLAQLMFQNAAHGLLSSDGQRLFVIEDNPVFTLGRTSMRFGRNQNTKIFSGNRLKAYDLQTGRPLWEAGGPASIEEFALPLSGHFFLGAPVSDGGDLFVLTESDSEICLQALDAETGHPKWAQPIAYADRRIDQDPNRRMWSSHLAVADGTVICPTGVGWLVAVDRTRRSVQWTYRYSPRKKQDDRNQRRFGSSGVPVEAMNQRWLVSAPVVRGEKLFFTPAETTDEANISSGTFVCLDLATGKRIWQRPKSSYLYLAGVLEDRAILIGTNSAQAISLKGSTLWDCPFGSESKPSGRAVIVDDILYQPLQRNELVGINLKTGKVVSTQTLPYNERPLGNLLTYRGMLISYHPAAVTAWEQKDALERQLAEIREQSREDVDSLILEASAAAAEGEFDRGLSLLDRVVQSERYQQSPDVRLQVDDLTRRVIVSRIRRSPGEHPELHDRLTKLVRSPEEAAENHQLKFVTASALGRHVEAFGVLAEMISAPGQIPFTRADNRQVESEEDGWLRGHLVDTWSKLDEAGQAEASEQLRKLVKSVSSNTDRVRLARLLPFHASTEPLREGFAATAIEDGRLHEATGWLMQSQWSSNLPKIAAHFVTLIERHRKVGDSVTALRLAGRLSSELGEVTLPDGRSVKGVVSLFLTPSPNRSADSSNWGDFDMKLTRTATSYSYSSVFGLNPRSGHSTALDGLRVEWVQQSYGSVTQRINFVDETDGSLYWSVPVRTGTSGSSVNRHFHLGTTMIVFSRGVFNCLSIPDRRVLWTQLAGAPDSGSSRIKRNYRAMSTGSSFLNEVPGRSSMGAGPVPVVNSNYVCYRARRRITILDTQTGEVLWTRRAIPAGTRIFGTLSRLIILPASGTGDYALRATDGKRALLPEELEAEGNQGKEKVTPIRTFLTKALLINDNTLIMASTQKGNAARIVIQARNLESNESLWEKNFPATSRFRGSADDELAILSTDGKLQLLDLLTGTLKSLGSLPEISAKRTEYFVLSDRQHIYLVLNGQSRSRSYYGELQTIRASHDIVAFDRQSGEFSWHQKIASTEKNQSQSQSLVVTDLERNPVMILISNSYDQKLQTQLVKIMTVDKRSGRILNEYAAPGYPGYRSLRIDPQRKYIDLISYQDRIRLTAVPKQAVPEQATSKKEAPKEAVSEKAVPEPGPLEPAPLEKAVPGKAVALPAIPKELVPKK